MAVQPALGNCIRELMKLRNVSRSDLAESLVVTDHFVYLLETGRRNCSAKVLEDLAHALEVPTSALNVLATNDLNGASGKILRQLKRSLIETVKAQELAKKRFGNRN